MSRFAPGDEELFEFLLPPGAHAASLYIGDEDLADLAPLLPGEGPAPTRRWAPKRLREYHAGRVAARLALEPWGYHARPLVADADGVPDFPTGLAASLTHTGRERTYAAAAALAGALGIGIDAEEHQLLEQEVAEHVLSEAEWETLPPWGSPRELALLVFSAKEAFYKCIFPKARTFLGFREVELRMQRIVPSERGRRGDFVVSYPGTKLPGGPRQLPGRFVWTPERVVTAVVWDS